MRVNARPGGDFFPRFKPPEKAGPRILLAPWDTILTSETLKHPRPIAETIGPIKSALVAIAEAGEPPDVSGIPETVRHGASGGRASSLHETLTWRSAPKCEYNTAADPSFQDLVHIGKGQVKVGAVSYIPLERREAEFSDVPREVSSSAEKF